jgi:hypothetical protein
MNSCIISIVKNILMLTPEDPIPRERSGNSQKSQGIFTSSMEEKSIEELLFGYLIL